MFEHKKNFSLIWLVHSCLCYESTESLQKSAYAGIRAKDLWKVALGKYDTDKSKKKCKKCLEQFNSHHRTCVATTTWFIHFSVIIDQNSISSPTLLEFPNAMALTELRTRNEVRFEFGYIGFATSNDAPG
jgi:hypothetical protein